MENVLSLVRMTLTMSGHCSGDGCSIEWDTMVRRKHLKGKVDGSTAKVSHILGAHEGMRGVACVRTEAGNGDTVTDLGYWRVGKGQSGSFALRGFIAAEQNALTKWVVPGHVAGETTKGRMLGGQRPNVVKRDVFNEAALMVARSVAQNNSSTVFRQKSFSKGRK